MNANRHIPPGRPVIPRRVADHPPSRQAAPLCDCYSCPSAASVVFLPVDEEDEETTNEETHPPTTLCEKHALQALFAAKCGAEFLAKEWRHQRQAGRLPSDAESLCLLVAAGLRLGRGEPIVEAE